MEHQKERLIGFVALGLLAVIVLPMLFDGQGVRESQLQVSIPDAPRFPVMSVPVPEARILDDTRKPAEPMPERVELRQPRMKVTAEVATPLSDTPEQPDDGEVSAPAEVAPELTPKQPRPATLEKEVPVLDKQGVPVAWTLQLAAFKERANAERLRDRLNKAGYSAYIREKNALSRVYVGPEVQRSELEALKRKLSRELKLDGLILRFSTS
ncbi:SPOR domain-containing protein [Motiliproteus sediminis]|uniref:SPOR domain-containing protein n=1 Tax=Motiliproteus sediminis TaxID=1468178 RepID=UPI001AEFDFED|nr:SPOR domain-containing protein [Motiliproteus sediminis]